MGLPGKGDTRTAGQRRADALLELAQRKSGDSGDGAGPRPQLVIRTSLDTLVGAAGAGAGELEWGGTVPAETVRRLACDAALTRITGNGELNFESPGRSGPFLRQCAGRSPSAITAASHRVAAGRPDGPTRIT